MNLKVPRLTKDEPAEDSAAEKHLKPGEGDGEPYVNPKMWEGRKKPSRVEEADWVFDNMAFPPNLLVPVKAPSAGAWSMYLWARKHPDKFYSGIFSKLLPTRADRPKDPRDQAETDPALETIRKVREARDNALPPAAPPALTLQVPPHA
jgi:hypothetical protein